MKYSSLLIFVFFFLSCSGDFLEQEEVEQMPETIEEDFPEKMEEYSKPENPIIEFDSLTPIIQEKLVGPTIIRESPDGQISMKIHLNNVLVQTSSEQAGKWKLLGIEIDESFEFKDIDKGNIHQEIWKNGKHFATTYYIKDKKNRNYAPYIWYDDDFIRGYAEKNKIIPTGIPENELENLISNGNLSKTAFDKFLWSFQFQYSSSKLGDYKNIQQFYKHPVQVDGRSAPDRLLLIFQKDVLIAVQHDRPLHLLGFKSLKCEHGLSLVILADWSQKEKQKFVNTVSNCKFK
jgi:hypothetical protein